MPSREDLIEELQEAAEELGRAPSLREFKDLSDVSKYHLLEEFGSWNAARNEADLEFIQKKFGTAEGEPVGYTPTSGGGPDPTPEEELQDEIHRLADELGRIPTKGEMDKKGDFSSGTYERRFGTWREAVAQAGYEPRASMDNQSGKNNYNWKGGYGNYGGVWDEARKKALERDNRQCRICGFNAQEHKEKYGRSLDIHHIQPSRTFDDQRDAHELSNLITLCLPCHKKWEGIPLRPDTRD
jgi:hypothetical protein